MVWFVGVEGDARAVVRPRWPPRFKRAFRDLNRFTSRRRNHVDAVPPVVIAQKCYPPPIGRGHWLRPRLPVRKAPELLLNIFVDGARSPILRVSYIDRPSL